MPSATPLRPTLLVASLLAALSAHAQQAAPLKEDRSAPAAMRKDEVGKADVQTVQIQGKADAYDPRRDDTASKIVVNHDELVKYGDTGVLDALKRVPGVTVSGSAGRGGEIRMRGLGAGYTQVLLNGERAPAGFDISTLSPDVIERIEVLRAASAEYSTQSIAGTVNIVLKKAVRTAQRELKVGYGHGNAQNSPTASLQLADKAGKLSWSVGVNVFRNRWTEDPETVDTFLDAAGNLAGLRHRAVPQDGMFTAYSVTPRLNYSFANGDTFSAQTLANGFRFGASAAERVRTLAGAPPASPVLDQDTRNRNRMFREELNWVHKFASGAKLDAKLSATYTGIESKVFSTGSGNPAAGDPAAGDPAAGKLYQLIDSDAAGRGLSSTGKYTSALFEGHALAFGWDGGYSTGDDTRRQRDYRRPEVALPGGDDTYESEIARLALYAQDEWNVTPRWSVYLGARWEGIRNRTAGDGFDTVHNRSSVLSPIAQTLYKLPDTKGDQVRFAVTRTYKAPNVQALIPHRYESINNSQTAPDTSGNPNLKPELALGFDASYEHYAAGGALLSASVSSRRISDTTRNLIQFDGARWVSTPSNVGSARTHGIELEARFPLKALVDTKEALDLRASVSRNWSSVDAVPGPDNRLSAQTPLSATLGADYRKGPATVGASFVFKNGGFVRVSGNQTAYESVRRDLDLYALWKFNPALQLRVATSNLLAQDTVSESAYIVPGVGGQSSRTLTPVHRSVRATLEMKF